MRNSDSIAATAMPIPFGRRQSASRPITSGNATQQRTKPRTGFEVQRVAVADAGAGREADALPENWRVDSKTCHESRSPVPSVEGQRGTGLVQGAAGGAAYIVAYAHRRIPRPAAYWSGAVRLGLDSHLARCIGRFALASARCWPALAKALAEFAQCGGQGATAVDGRSRVPILQPPGLGRVADRVPQCAAPHRRWRWRPARSMRGATQFRVDWISSSDPLVHSLASISQSTATFSRSGRSKAAARIIGPND